MLKNFVDFENAKIFTGLSGVSMAKKIIPFFVLFGLLFSSKVMAAESIQFGLIKNVPPYSYDENGVLTGIDYEVFLELQRRMGFQSNLKLFPFKRLWEYMQKGQLDVILQIYFKPERRKYIIYSTWPVRWSTHYIFVHRDRKKDYSRSDITVLYGKTVGKDRGYFVSKAFDQAVAENRFTVDEAGTTAANIKKLARKRVDCYVSAYPVAMATAKQLGLQNEIVRLDEPIIPKKGVFMAVSKKGENVVDKQAFIERVSFELEQMHKDGTMTRIEDIFFK